MADNQSRGLAELVRNAEPIVLESVDIADGIATIRFNGMEFTEIKRVPTQKKATSTTVKIDVDVAEALTGLKAVERQAKKATQALRETESTAQRLKVHLDANGAEYYGNLALLHAGERVLPNTPDFTLSHISTRALSEEMARREGVTEYYVAPHGARAELWIRDADSGVKHDLGSGAVILVNRD